MKYILGIKKGMTRVYDDTKSVPVTVVDQESCVISLVEKEGYELGLGKKKHPNKALAGKYAKLGYVPQFRFWVTDEAGELKIGDKVELTSEMLGELGKVVIKGVSKGKGFQGVVKRYRFAGGPKTHGQSDRLRAPGSIGAGTDPGRVFKGKRMGGRMGGENIAVKNKKIVAVKDNYVLVSGAVPGSKGGLVVIETTK